jgi:SAM-dependent methyltransferase
VIDRVARLLPLATPVARALDVGCGAGLSTAPLAALARQAVGIDPSHAMVRLAAAAGTGARFLTGRAERLPVQARSIDLMTAAGSLNWVDLEAFWPETERVLAPGGTLVVYDFSPGREFRGSEALSSWFAAFEQRYPSPPARAIDPATVVPEGRRVRLRGHETFAVGLTLSPGFYLEYVLTETCVAAAIASGTPAREIRSWCRDGLAAFFDMPREVLFRGYIAVIGVDARPA